MDITITQYEANTTLRKKGKGLFVTVDDEDFEYLSRFFWSTTAGNGTVTPTREFTVGGKNVHLAMWKFLMRTENNKTIVFRNGNSLDYRKENIFLAPRYMSTHMDRKKKLGYCGREPTSKYKGVSYSGTYPGRKKWVAAIKSNEKKFVKRFLTEREAGIAYNRMASDIYGDNAYQNKIE